MQAIDRTSDFVKATNAAGWVVDEDTSTENSSFWLQTSNPKFNEGLTRRGISSQSSSSHVESAGSEISDSLAIIASKLERLEKCVKQRSLFNDNSLQIDTLTREVKTSLTKITSQLEDLEASNSKVQGRNDQARTHGRNMIDALRKRLLDLTRDFKSILQTRTENLKKLDDRRRLYSTATYAESYDTQAFSLANKTRDLESGELLQTQIRPKKVTYTESRKEVVDSVQRAIVDLAGIFQRVATVVSQQDEMIQRIDDSVDDSLHNLREGQSHLLKYANTISTNRVLILKIFGIILAFILFYIFFIS